MPLEAAARSGSNFAGGFALARLNCTPDCDTVAVIDLHTGAVVFRAARTCLAFLAVSRRARHDVS